MNKYASLLQLLTQKHARLKMLLSFNHKGYLNTLGWFRAFESMSPVDKDGNPLPWVTYSFIDFIKGRLNKTQSVFEFGSGNSTLYYAKNTGLVVSVEHDKAWFDKISKAKPSNSEMIYCEMQPDGDYCRVPLKLDEKFDIIIVDAVDRVNCCIQAVGALTPTGVIVLDDSERPEYKPGIDFLLAEGFKELTFSGVSPGLFYYKSTMVFYKAGNCLGI